MQIDIYLAARDEAFSTCAATEVPGRVMRGVKFTVSLSGGIAALATEDEVLAVCERVFSLANGHPQDNDEHASATYYGSGARSLSVGDVVHVPGHGLYLVDRCGWVAASKLIAAAS